MSEEVMNQEMIETMEEQQVYGDKAVKTGGCVVFNKEFADGTRLALPLPVTHGQIVEAIKAKAALSDEYDARRLALEAEMIASVTLGEDFDELAYEKARKVIDIEQYDASDNVNQFTLNGKAMWLNDAMRTKLAKRFDTDEQDGLEVTRLIYDGEAFELPIATAKGMLHQIESYARDCFDHTNEHIAAVMAKKKVDTVIAYDYITGYPEKLTFEF